MASQLGDRPLDLVQRTLLTIGYDDRAIVANYDFAVSGNPNALDQVDIAAFSDPIRHDLHTSCIAAQHVTPQSSVQATLEKLSYLAAPVALILQADGVDIWPVRRTPSLAPLDHVPYDRLIQYFSERGKDFRPDALGAAKAKGQQITFFDLDLTLLQFAYDATQRILVERFETAVSAARDTLGVQAKKTAADLTKAALQILAAAILEDKRLLEGERSSTVEDLVRRSAIRYGQYFDENSLNRIGRDVGQVAFDALRRNVTFRSFTNEMLGYFYENAFLNQELRRQLGVYYTPQSIARRILTRLPVEDIPPTERVVFDGSSGSGNLLLAGYERLVNLLPSGWDRERKHNYLVRRVHGVDVDQFATQVAGLSLFFIDLPAGDAWDVRTADFLSSESMGFSNPPTILVGNPPFEELRSSEGKRRQRASLFLSKYLDLLQPEGLLGVVLPETFLENSSCREARRRLFEECEILELWHLPEGMFPMSNVATVIVLAKKLPAVRSRLRGPVRVERVAALPLEKEQFLNGDRPRFSYVVPSTGRWAEEPESRIPSSPLERSVWDVIDVSRRLRDVALVRNGINPGKDQRANHFAYFRQDTDWKPWLDGARRFEPYALKPVRTKYVRYPGNLERPRPDLESVFATPMSKVLVNSGRAPGNPWRVYATIDDFGYFPSHGIYCVVPNDDLVSLEELVAFLNSPVASAWIDSRNRKRWVGQRIIGDMPFPIFTNHVRELIIAHVSEVMALKQRALAESSRRQPHTNRIRNLVLSIDDLIYDAFHVNDEGRAMLSKFFAGYRRPGLEWDGYSQPIEEVVSTGNERTWSVTGQVIRVDVESNVLTVWARGYNDSQPFQIPIPESMPGWALRPETAFEAEVPWRREDSDHLAAEDIANVRPLDFSYSEPEKLVELLGNPNKLDELYGL